MTPNIDPGNINEKAAGKKKENKNYFQQLKRRKPKQLDKLFHQLHDEVFSCTDCLQCANCCKTTGPLFTNKDIERLASHFKLKPSEFTARLLRMDEDGDYVLKTLPCPFLNTDNTCSIYQLRPKACREYPHTDRKNMHQILDITLKNISVCPAVFNVVEKLKKRLP